MTTAPAQAALIAPHGGQLVHRVASPAEAEAIRSRLPGLPQVRLSERQLSDLEMIAIGGFSPLTGYMTSADYRRVVSEMHLANGLPWSMPITLAVDRTTAAGLREGGEVALLHPDGEPVGLLKLEEQYGYDRALEARAVYRTEEAAHPGVAVVYGQGDTLLGGPVTLLERQKAATFRQYRLDPAETRAAFAARGWSRVVGFQTRNPVHRAHEYIQKCALEIVDGLLLHPLVGETKGDDIPAAVRMRCYEVLLAGYYPADRVLLAAGGDLPRAGAQELWLLALHRGA